jgi:hypothetical protein
VFTSLKELFAATDLVAMPADEFPGEFIDGPWVLRSRRPLVPCEVVDEYLRSREAQQVVYGRLRQPDIFMQWDGSAVEYNSRADSQKAEGHSAKATHFVYSRAGGIGFIFERTRRTWRLLGIDCLAPEC